MKRLRDTDEDVQKFLNLLDQLKLENSGFGDPEFVGNPLDALFDELPATPSDDTMSAIAERIAALDKSSESVRRYKLLLTQEPEAARKLASLRDRLVRRRLDELVEEKLVEQGAEVEPLQRDLTRLRSEEYLLKGIAFDGLSSRRPAATKVADVSFQMAEFERESHVYDLITDRVAMMRTEARGPARVTPLKDASPPAEPVSAWWPLARGNNAIAATGRFASGEHRTGTQLQLIIVWLTGFCAALIVVVVGNWCVKRNRDELR